MTPEDEDRKRFEIEQRRESEATRRIERSLQNAFVEWLIAVAKPLLKRAVQGLFDWLRGFFR